MSEDLPKGWRSSYWWQEKVAELVGHETHQDALGAAEGAWKDAMSEMRRKGEPEPATLAIHLGHMLVHVMAAGGLLKLDLGLAMSVVCNRLERAVDPIAPDWEAEIPKEDRPEPELDLGVREPIEEVGDTEIWVNFTEDEWRTVERYQGDPNLVAGEMAYGLWRKEPPDMEAWAGDRRTVFKKGVVVLGVPLTRNIDMLLLESEMPGGMFYVLAGVDEKKKRVRLFGWATSEEITSAKIVERGKKHVRCRSLPATKLHPMKGKS